LSSRRTLANTQEPEGDEVCIGDDCLNLLQVKVHAHADKRASDAIPVNQVADKYDPKDDATWTRRNPCQKKELTIWYKLSIDCTATIAEKVKGQLIQGVARQVSARNAELLSDADAEEPFITNDTTVALCGTGDSKTSMRLVVTTSSQENVWASFQIFGGNWDPQLQYLKDGTSWILLAAAQAEAPADPCTSAVGCTGCADKKGDEQEACKKKAYWLATLTGKKIMNTPWADIDNATQTVDGAKVTVEASPKEKLLLIARCNMIKDMAVGAGVGTMLGAFTNRALQDNGVGGFGREPLGNAVADNLRYITPWIPRTIEGNNKANTEVKILGRDFLRLMMFTMWGSALGTVVGASNDAAYESTRYDAAYTPKAAPAAPTDG